MLRSNHPERRLGAPLNALRRYTRRAAEVEPCELCGVALIAGHQHLVIPTERKLFCTCDACVILLSGGPGSKFRRVAQHIQFLSDFHLADAQWAALGIPIGLAFFFQSTPLDKLVAAYPSPAGPIESFPPPAAWQRLTADNPSLENLEPDVEALLVNRLRGALGAYRAPIDQCYRLVGIVRTHWRGFSGGADVWQRIDEFFLELQKRAAELQERQNA